MLSLLRKWLILTVFILLGGYLVYQGFLFRQAQVENILPPGTVVAGVDVSGLTLEDARLQVSARYYRPLYIFHGDDHVELDPHDVGFVLDEDTMFGQLQTELSQENVSMRFASFVLKRPLKNISIPLVATHDRDGLIFMLQNIAKFLDQPAEAPQMLPQQIAVKEGHSGLVTDIDASLPAVEEVLYRPENRGVHLVIVEQPAPEMSMALLEEAIRNELNGFDGTGSIFVMDLQTGEEININSDIAVTGTSILKIAIFVEAYRVIDGTPNDYQQQLFLDTAAHSSNYSANLLLHELAGEPNTYAGADILTESMRELGLVNTFIAVPFDVVTPPSYRQITYVTPANSRSDGLPNIDPSRQTTAEDIGTLLSMIYYCSKGGGALLAVYPDELTPSECQAIIDLMVLNEEGNLIRYGVPEGTIVSHKHGWAEATHGDAGIVYTPGGDFVIVEYLSGTGDWLEAGISFPILREIARATYNYFNLDDPYLGDVNATRVEIDPIDPFSENQGTADGTTTEEQTVEGQPVEQTPTPEAGG
ncbi:MAG: serine hydrolase [Candidatus Promineifilaceae bacterium]